MQTFPSVLLRDRGTTDNNAVRAYARLRRAPGYTAPRLWGMVTGRMRSGGAWLRSVRAWRRVANL